MDAKFVALIDALPFGKNACNALFIMALIIADVEKEKIMALLGIRNNTYKKYKNIVEAVDFSFIFDKKKSTRKPQLEAIKAKLIAYFDSNPPRTLREAACAIKAQFGASVSIPSACRFMKANGVKRLKVGSFPSKANPMKQREFLNSVLLPLIDAAKKGAESLFFADASHFIHAFHPAYAWSQKRVFTETASGRKRHDVPGP
ncbi:MAG: hypothetical protein LBU32_18850 [Clostridiales bacterium]|jgi:hypothetical protein|nr:hypothetical protein [Clostridiales bacterium]